jgi:hypothetical protein
MKYYIVKIVIINIIFIIIIIIYSNSYVTWKILMEI